MKGVLPRWVRLGSGPERAEFASPGQRPGSHANVATLALKGRHNSSSVGHCAAPSVLWSRWRPARAATWFTGTQGVALG